MRRGLSLALLVLAWTDAIGACVLSGYDPALISAWADAVEASERGPLDIANPGLGFPTQGTPADALGPADGLGVYSLGDGGFVTAELSEGIWDGPGHDFAVYENSFWNLDGLFAEFAYVEVSSNGIDFARFPGTTDHAIPVSSFGSVHPCDFQNFAGDKPANEGTGFDLAELADHSLVRAGMLDLGEVVYVRVVDVIGDGSTLDASGAPIYDPYPTVFDTGGFDVDAIGALHAPEPATSLSLVAGIAGVGWLSRRRGSRPRKCARRR